MSLASPKHGHRGRAAPALRWLEWLVVFAGAPVLVAAELKSGDPLAALWGLAALAGILLMLTPGFRWRVLRRRIGREGWRIFWLSMVVTGLWCVGLGLAFAPTEMGALPSRDPVIWVAVALAYPILSALPQELIFRTLFFERYGGLFADRRLAAALNGAAFAFAHLLVGHIVAFVVTGVAGAVIGWAYLRRRSLALAVLMHGTAGLIAVTCGLGGFLHNG